MSREPLDAEHAHEFDQLGDELMGLRPLGALTDLVVELLDLAPVEFG